MKLLVDTSVWSLALRRKPTASLSAEEEQLRELLSEAIRNGWVVMIGPIRQELLSGIKEAAQFERLKIALVPFRDEIIETADYEDAARMYNLCRSRGLACGPVDMLICAAAVRRHWELLTGDVTMRACLRAITQKTP